MQHAVTTWKGLGAFFWLGLRAFCPCSPGVYRVIHSFLSSAQTRSRCSSRAVSAGAAAVPLCPLVPAAWGAEQSWQCLQQWQEAPRRAARAEGSQQRQLFKGPGLAAPQGICMLLLLFLPFTWGWVTPQNISMQLFRRQCKFFVRLPNCGDVGNCNISWSKRKSHPHNITKWYFLLIIFN